jgi:hypothetical protein
MRGFSPHTYFFQKGKTMAILTSENGLVPVTVTKDYTNPSGAMVYAHTVHGVPAHEAAALVAAGYATYFELVVEVPVEPTPEPTLVVEPTPVVDVPATPEQPKE